MDKQARESALRGWIEQQRPSSITEWQMISGDASFRRYFRFKEQGQTWIAVDAPPERENVQGFLRLASVLAQKNVVVPAVLAADAERGFWCLTDFGDTLLLSVLNDKTVHGYYTAAIDELLTLQHISDVGDYVLPHYDRERFSIEVQLMPTWFLQAHLNYTCTDRENQMVQQTFEHLIEQALAQPNVLTHRDFHARNLMVLPNSPRLGVIDFQDAVWGPLTYDLVSLLKDCYIAWPRATVLAMVEYYCRRAQHLTAMQSVNREQFIRWFDLMGLQRHIKVMGIFCRLYYRDGKKAYLNDLTRVVEHAIDAALRYPETEAFGQWLRDVIVAQLHEANATVLTPQVSH